MDSKLRQFVGLGVFVAVCLSAAGIGSVFTASSVKDWYVNLRKPSWTPPGWLFGPVWTVLYLSMAVAAWLAWRRGGLSGAPAAMVLFGVQLALNAAWSSLFFGLRSPGWAFVEIVLLWLAIAATTVLLWRVSAWAGSLMLPYWLWVTFAAGLNYSIWRMNA